MLLVQTSCVGIETQEKEAQPQVLPVPDSEQLPDVIKALLKKSDEQYLAGDFNASLETLERALRINPAFAEVWSRMAQAYLMKDNLEQARQYAQRSNSVVQRNNSALQKFNTEIINLSKKQLSR